MTEREGPMFCGGWCIGWLLIFAVGVTCWHFALRSVSGAPWFDRAICRAAGAAIGVSFVIAFEVVARAFLRGGGSPDNRILEGVETVIVGPLLFVFGGAIGSFAFVRFRRSDI